MTYHIQERDGVQYQIQGYYSDSKHTLNTKSAIVMHMCLGTCRTPLGCSCK